MSLKKFHIFFIVVSGLLALGMVFWGVYFYKTTGQYSGFFFSGLGIAGAVLLYRYLRWFLDKYSKILSLASLAVMVGLLAPVQELMACGTCYVDPDNPMVKGAIWGVWFLVVVIVSVLLSIIYIARGWMKRADALKTQL